VSKTPREMIEDLKELDPDYVVDVLEITAEELVEAFPYKVRAFIAAELGEDNDEDDTESE
jgi:hypothetical protein